MPGTLATPPALDHHMTPQPQTAEGPASLNPRSAGCILTAVAILGAVVAAWLGMRLLKASSGDMALAAARNGVATSGLEAETRQRIEKHLLRVEAAHHGGELTPAQVISSVNGLLQTPCLTSLRLLQILERDLPASTLPEDQQGEVADALTGLWRQLLREEVTVGQVSEALGLSPGADGAAAPLLRDQELLAIRARAMEIRAAIPEGSTEGSPPLPDPLDDFRLHVDAVLGEAP